MARYFCSKKHIHNVLPADFSKIDVLSKKDEMILGAKAGADPGNLLINALCNAPLVEAVPPDPAPRRWCPYASPVNRPRSG